MRRPTTISILALALATAARSIAQQPVAGTRVEAVQLDVIVTDASGKPVTGLTKDDFLVLEDKKDQKLTTFVFVEPRLGATAGSAPAPAAAASVAPATTGTAPAAAEKASGPGRHLVIVIDDLHIAPGNIEFVKGALRKLVDNFLGPDDSIAIVTTSAPAGSQPLSTNAAALKQGIDQLAFHAPPMMPAAGSQMTPAQAELVLRGDTGALRLAARRMIEETGSVLNATAAPGAAGGSLQAAAAVGQAAPAQAANAEEAVAMEQAKRDARGILNEALRFSAATLHTIEDVMRALAPVPGRKLCLLVSDGFLVGTGTSEERTRDLRAIIDAATRSGTVVYSIDSHGLVGMSGDASAASSTQAVASAPGLETSVDRTALQLFRMTLESVSADTGGFLVYGTNDFDTGVKKMLAENDSYYLMAYEPTNPKRDGKFRRIEVKLPRHADYVVRTRRGYLAPDDNAKANVRTASHTTPPPPPTTRGIDEAEARQIIDASRAEKSLPVSFAVDFVDVPASGSLAVLQAHVDVAALGSSPFAVDVLGGVYDATGKAVGTAFGRHNEVAAGDVARVRKDGVLFQQRLALPPGRYEVRLAARDAGKQKLGGSSQWIEIPNLKDGSLALSGVFLSKGAPKAAGPGGDSGEDIKDVQALRRFTAKDNLYFQVYVYNLKEEPDADAVMQAQLRQGETLVAASSPQPVKVERKDGAILPQTNGMPLSGLPAGKYSLRVVVVDKRVKAQVSRDVDFSVE
jgi:VWFA-related protein